MRISERIHELVWGPWLLLFFLSCGIFFTVKLRGFQIFRLNLWWKETIGFQGEKQDGKSGDKNPDSDRRKQNISTSCTALAATIGTGNIAGVATAIMAGGAGAVFWMWVSAFLGMATAYAETFLGVKYRNPKCGGGPFFYLERGLGWKTGARLYAFFCVIASFGIGSMVQANSISESCSYVFPVSEVCVGLIVTFLSMSVVLGGISRIAKTAERLVPFSAGLYIILCGIVILAFFDRIPTVCSMIFSEAFSKKSAIGGAGGFCIGKAVRYGMARGVFSNEAGLGSLAVLHSAAGETTPREQGLWAVFEVFFDTILSCSLTAFVILCVMGAGENGMAVSSKIQGSAVMAYCFSKCFDKAGAYLAAGAMSLFAFATIIAWYYLGKQAAVYLTEGGKKQEMWLAVYAFLYLNAVFFGCVAKLELVWNVSDIFNGLMAAPNLIGILLLSKEVETPF